MGPTDIRKDVQKDAKVRFADVKRATERVARHGGVRIEVAEKRTGLQTCPYRSMGLKTRRYGSNQKGTVTMTCAATGLPFCLAGS